MSAVEVQSGSGPVILGLPHTGTTVPDAVYEQLTTLGRQLSDTDWHVDRLYEGLLPDVTSVRATFHRYVIDANCDPSGASLYPGQNTTGLVPLTDFNGEPLWNSIPSASEIKSRIITFHAPYHAALEQEIQRVRKVHGVAILFDCHSIRSTIPYLFEGLLPDLNLGTNDGQTCAPELQSKIELICQEAHDYTNVFNGRFKGGWTTRHYGRPTQGVHTLQMELAQSTYLQDEFAPFNYDAGKAERLRETLREILEVLANQALSYRAPK